MRPVTGSYPKFLETYISKVTEDNAHEALRNNTRTLFAFLDSIPESKGDFAYADGKWTIKQLLIHIADAERIFSYRALRFARGDEQQPLPFEEDDYAANCNAEKRTLKSVIEELRSVRQATMTLTDSFGDTELSKPGNTASGRTTVNAVIYAICGHAAHHMNVAKERYLK
jgi:uncharacterized damage-inducible protein DinB